MSRELLASNRLRPPPNWRLMPSMIASQVWELVRSFDQPQRYKPFVRNCVVRGDQLEVGSVRDVNVKTGLPATTSTERLEQLDDDLHILGVKFVGGDHRLQVSASATAARLLYFPAQALFQRPACLSVFFISALCEIVCLPCYHFSSFYHLTTIVITGCYE
jgi:hypothetical protein